MFKNYWLVFIVFIAILLRVQPVSAANLTVNAITPYAVADGLCSIVEAIDNANDDAATHADCAAGAGADNIQLSRNIVLNGTTTFTASGDNGLPPITSTITIEGNGFSIIRNSANPFRFFFVDAAGELSLDQLTLSNGLITANFDNGGAIYNNGALMLTESAVQNSRVESIFPSGGGIYSTGTLILINSTVRNNRADNNNAAQVFDFGGGIYSTGTLNITNSTISNNHAAENGGGIYSVGDSTIINSTITANTAENGAGLLSFDNGGNAVRIYNSTFSNNIASIAGGGILNGADDVEIFGTTFSGNRVQGASAIIGGAIYNLNGIITITNSIIENNRALNNAFAGGIGSTQLSTTTIIGSIIRGNHSDNGGGGLYTALATTYVYDSLVTQNTAQRGGGFHAAPSNIESFHIIRSSIINNQGSFAGGGFYAEGNQTTSYLINSTVSGNFSPTFGGGVMLNAGGQVDILHSTIANNSSTQFANSVGGTSFFSGTATVTSSIIADNSNEDCSATNASISGDYNITTGPSDIAVTRWCSFIPIQANDMTSTDPLLAPLAANGNLGNTHLLQAGSPAIDVIPAACPAALDGIDQRGVPRTGATCDVGAIADDNLILPIVSFTSSSTLINDEATAGTQVVDILVDNTNGNLTAPGSLPLTLYVSATGTAADGTDFTDNLALAATYLFNAGNFPPPGTSATISLSFDVIDDLLVEGNETIDLALSLIGPGVLGQVSNHRLTIIDDDLVPVIPQAPVTVSDNAAIGVFDPGISKLGFLVSGQSGVIGEQIEWVVTVSNLGTTVGSNVTITDTLIDALQVDSVDAPNANASINGQTVSVTYPILNVGETVQFSIITTVLQGTFITNTACVLADNQAAEACVTGSLISQLPATGELPIWRNWLFLIGSLLLLTAIVLPIRKLKRE